MKKQRNGLKIPSDLSETHRPRWGISIFDNYDEHEDFENSDDDCNEDDVGKFENSHIEVNTQDEKREKIIRCWLDEVSKILLNDNKKSKNAEGELACFERFAFRQYDELICLKHKKENRSLLQDFIKLEKMIVKSQQYVKKLEKQLALLEKPRAFYKNEFTYFLCLSDFHIAKLHKNFEDTKSLLSGPSLLPDGIPTQQNELTASVTQFGISFKNMPGAPRDFIQEELVKDLTNTFNYSKYKLAQVFQMIAQMQEEKPVTSFLDSSQNHETNERYIGDVLLR